MTYKHRVTIFFDDDNSMQYEMNHPGDHNAAFIDSCARSLYERLREKGREGGNPLIDKRTVKRTMGQMLGGPKAMSMKWSCDEECTLHVSQVVAVSTTD